MKGLTQLLLIANLWRKNVSQICQFSANHFDRVKSFQAFEYISFQVRWVFPVLMYLINAKYFFDCSECPWLTSVREERGGWCTWTGLWKASSRPPWSRSSNSLWSKINVTKSGLKKCFDKGMWAWLLSGRQHTNTMAWRWLAQRGEDEQLDQNDTEEMEDTW